MGISPDSAWIRPCAGNPVEPDSSKEQHMIGTILSALVVGLIVGALARLIMPGKQNIGVIMTIILGALGSFIGAWLTYSLGYSNSNGGWQIIPFLVGIIVAIILIAIYVGITGRARHQDPDGAFNARAGPIGRRRRRSRR